MSKLAAVDSVPEVVVSSSKKSKRIDVILQGKGGVGKSLIASLIAQYFNSVGAQPVCLDTDPVNQTFSNYTALNAKFVPILSGSKIDERKFDDMMETLLTGDGTFVIDNGASTFIPLTSYMAENNVVEMLEDAGYEVYFHTVVTGGQALFDTLAGFQALAKMTASSKTTANIVVWLNEFFGPIEYEGKTFLEMKSFIDLEARVKGVVVLHKRNADTFGRDVDAMTARKLVFDEAINDPAFSLMAKQRLTTVRRDVFAQIEKIGF